MSLKKQDPELYNILEKETKRQKEVFLQINIQKDYQEEDTMVEMNILTN